MNAVAVAVCGILIFFLGYKYYSKFLSTRIYQLDPNYQTPAHAFKDGVDFVPTNKWVLWGHHFTSVAGAAPIVGPAIAVYWGWLPAFLWVVLGTVFAAGVHDFGALVLSVRHKGQSVGTLASKIIGQRAKLLFLFIILILVLMVNAVFAWVISNLFIQFPAAVLSVFIQIPLAIWIGYTVYKKRGGMLLPSLCALVIMYFSAILSSRIPALQIDLPRYFGGEETIVAFGLNGVAFSFFIWIIILMIYVYVASTLPVWKLLQPRDYINSHQLVVGLAILYLGLLFSNPSITAPASNISTDIPWFPLLFITIACGAISGFHGLVASGTSSKQLNKEPDARFVGYFGAIGEGLLALAAILAVVTYFNSENDFIGAYSSFDTANANGLGYFIEGSGVLATGIFLPADIATTIVAIIVVSFAATTLDTSVRLMRYIISELGQEYNIKPLTKMHVATAVAVTSSAALVLLPEGPQGFGSGGYVLWPLFGTSNQLLAGITLLLVTLWLKRQGRNYLFTLIPMIFLMIMTVWAMTHQVFMEWSGIAEGENMNLLLFLLGAIILVFALWILLEALSGLWRKNTNNDHFST
ncbi:carbon starvation CstA family protein [Salipaludibacillus agaradhaerens]|uniref:carbon starvation CstA family protein n=1 Tax=Salipaludibacillus agaradhaerens TaxID=76935 RepID=UPI000997BF99|nr:carbon starvation protein A [Salipaludibacillus agaradhaerens]